VSGAVSGTAGGLAVKRATAIVPATIANLGAGYDCLGLAVDRWLSVAVEARRPSAAAPPVELAVRGEGAGEVPADRSNRVIEALEAGLGALGIADAGDRAWRVRMSNGIPLERGLGSSAAATVAGLKVAEAFAGRSLGERRLLELATSLDGHPDNVAPAFLGGLVASVALGNGLVEAVRLEPPHDVAVVAWIPERRLPTAAMRRVLPPQVPRSDAVANLARVGVAVAGLAVGRTDVLGLLTDDRLHEPHRAAVFPELTILEAAARGAGALGACLAGSGSTVVAFVAARDLDPRGRPRRRWGRTSLVTRVGAAMRAAAIGARLDGRLAVLAPRAEGARLRG